MLPLANEGSAPIPLAGILLALTSSAKGRIRNAIILDSLNYKDNLYELLYEYINSQTWVRYNNQSRDPKVVYAVDRWLVFRGSVDFVQIPLSGPPNRGTCSECGRCSDGEVNFVLALVGKDSGHDVGQSLLKGDRYSELVVNTGLTVF